MRAKCPVFIGLLWTAYANFFLRSLGHFPQACLQESFEKPPLHSENTMPMHIIPDGCIQRRGNGQPQHIS